MGDVIEIIDDGVSGLVPKGVDGMPIITGVSSSGHGQAVLMSKNSLPESLIGVGPLTGRVNDFFATGGQKAVAIVVPVAGSGGEVGDITKTGTGPDITAAGTVLAAAQVVLIITKSGARNTACYQLSTDADSFDIERTVPVDGLIPVGNTGVTITIPETQVVKDDTYTFDISPPTTSISNIIDAIDPVLETYDVEFVHVVGPSDSVAWAACGVKADELWNKHRPTFFLMEARLPAADETIDDWTAALMNEKATYAHRFVAVVAGFGEIMDSKGNRLKRNAAGLCAGRITRIPVMRHIGRVRDSGVSQVSMPAGYNQAHQVFLEKAGLITLQKYAGLSAAYWGDDKTLADKTSDYQFLTVLRVVFKAVRISRLQALKSMKDELGDPQHKEGAIGLKFLVANIQNGLDTMVTAVPSELAGHVVTIPEDQDFVNNGVAVSIKLVGIPIIKEIKLIFGYYYAGSTFDPRYLQ